MKKQFQSKAVPRGTRTIWRYLSALIILFTFGIGQMWAAYDVPVDGTVDLATKVNNGGRFNVEASGVYHFRKSSGYSFNAGDGIKTQSNQCGVVFYVDKSTEIEVFIKHKEAKNAHTVTVHVYSIPESEYQQFDNNKAGAAESNRTFSTGPSTSSDDSYSIAIAATSDVFSGKKTLASGYYAIVPVGEKSNTYFSQIKFTAAAKTNPTVTFNNGAYTVGGSALNLSTLFSSNSDGAVTYTVKTDGGTSASISGTSFTASAAGTAVVTASQAATSTYNAKAVDANIVVSVPSTPTHGITYNNTKGATNPNPDTYYEGTGVTSFEPLADVTDFHFTGWSPASISTTATGDQTIEAQWVAAYDVTFSAGAGSGTVPAAFQKWEGGKFNLPGQGEMTAPTGKAFDGWKANGAGDKLAADAEYTMGGADVEFVAQWKAVPTVLFHYQQSNLSANLAAGSYTATGGTLTTSADMSKESAAYNSAVPNDLKGGANVGKLGATAAYIQITLTTGKFQEGDTVYICGYKSYKISKTTELGGEITGDDAIATGTAKTDYNIGYVVLPEGVDQNSLYLSRAEGTGTGFAAVKVIRPAARDIASTVITLTDVKVGDASVTSSQLATILAEPYILALTDEFVDAPVIKFNEHTVITYVEGLPATKVTDKVYTVTATVNGDGKWQAAQEIAGTTYTVTAPKASSAKVTYYDGATKLGEETVAIGDAPADYADFQDKDYASFVGWYNNSDLAEEHKITDITALTISANTNVYGKWSPAYATSINIEQWVLDNGTGNSALRAELLARHYKYATLNNLDSLNDDPSKANRNYAYLGQKVNKTDSEISFLLKNGSTVKVRFGNLGSTINAVIGTADPVALTSADYANATPAGDKVYSYTATADVVVKFQCAGTSTSVFKQIMIDEEIQNVILPAIVTLDANGGTYTGESSVKYTGTALVIGNATPADADHVFDGWYDGETKVNAAAYVPTKNVTLQAHYANKPYTVTYVGGEGATGSMGPVQAAWGEDYTALACGFEKENHSFTIWAVSGVAGITEIAAGSAFVMPKGDVTLTAQWVNEALVARIGDNYYESLPEAVAAANDGDVVYLLKDVAAGPGVMIESANAKDITIDFGGYTYIVSTPAVGSTNTKTQGFHFEQGCTITMQNGTIGSTGDEVKMLVQNYCDLTLLNITLDGTDLAGTGRYTLSNNCGNVVIGNGAEIIAQDNGIAFDVCYYASYPSVSVTVMPGASIDGKIEMSMSNNKPNVEENCQLIITGGEFENFSIDHTNIPEANVNAAISAGTFDAPVENLYCAENYVPTDADPVTGKYSVEPKDGVCIVWADATGNNAMTVDATKSMYAATAAASNTKNTSEYGGKTGYKLNSRPANMSVTLTDETFQEGDIVEVFVTTVVNNAGVNDKMRVFDANDVADEHKLAEGTADMVQGANRLVLPATSTASLYLVRGAENAPYDMWNPHVAYIAVYRVIYPTLTAITINGRAGVIDEANKTVAVQIPYEAVLSSLTVVPTIVRNAPHATTPEAVISNEGAWVIGDNTYRVMDKDGDYTDYTITLDRDVQKHTVSFNTHGGSAVASEEVEHNAYLAAAPTAPSKEDYIFQYWSLTEDGEEVDVTTVQITEDKEFHAVWAADGAIKLLDGEGNINTTNFITGVTATTVTINEVEHKAAAWGGTQGAISGTNQLGKIVQYNATTNRTKIKVSVYNTNNSPKQVYLHKILEGETTAVVETLAVASKGNAPVESEYYEFNSDANRSFYLTTNSTDVKIVQVKVIESGDVTLKRAGEAGYELNLNKGRVLAYANTDINFEGLAFTASSNYGVISSSELQIKAPLSFTISSPVTLTLNNNSNKYQVSQSISGSGDEYAAGEQVLDLTTTGTWYIVPTTTSAVKLTSIAFALPKCDKPTVVDLANVELCAGEPYTELTVSATKSDEGTLHYAWFKEAGETDEAVGTDAASFTPAADGEYYVIVTNTLAGHQDNATTSNTISVAHFASVAITTAPEDVYKHAGLDAELSVVAEGKNVTYEWFTCDDELGTNPVAIVPAETGASLNLTAIEAGIKYYQVVVTDECGTTASAVTKVEGFNDIALQDVTGNMTWDFSKANDGTAATENLCTEKVLVNVAGINNDANFTSDNIMATANKFAGSKLQASMIKFHTTVSGIITVVFSHTGKNKPQRDLYVNDVNTGAFSTTSETSVTYKQFVQAGDVVLTVVPHEAGNGNMFNFTSVDFKVKATPDYSRDVTNNIGTLCVDHNVLAGGFLGATFYQIASRNQEYDYKIDFEEVLPNEELKAGEPYIFKSTTGRIDLYYGETSVTEPGDVRGMHGWFDATAPIDPTKFYMLDITEENKSDILYIAQNKLWNCEDLVDYDLKVVNNRAYIVMSEVPTYAEYQEAQQQPNNAPIRRCLTISGDQAPAVITGVEDLNVGDQPVKVMIDGQMFILRGEKMYDATGRLVK